MAWGRPDIGRGRVSAWVSVALTALAALALLGYLTYQPEAGGLALCLATGVSVGAALAAGSWQR
nr:hypothetical protein [Edwardsiella ictaluri]